MLSNSLPPPDDLLVIGIAGRIGAGKTTAGKYLGSKYGFQYLRYSQVLSNWLANDSRRKPNLQKIGWEVMEKGMQSDLNRRLIAQINPHADAAVDGLRHPLDYESLRNSFPSSFHLLFIESSRTGRWKGRRIKVDMRQLTHSRPPMPTQSNSRSIHSGTALDRSFEMRVRFRSSTSLWMKQSQGLK